MATEVTPDECFARETLPDDGPSHVWTLIELEQYARAQYEAIIRGETTLAPTYHRLGRSLELIRRKRGRGAWGKYLGSLGIHRVRACKARAIARHFATPDAVAEMAVEEAYEASKSKHPRVFHTRRDRANADHTDSKENQGNQNAAEPAREHEANEIEAFLADVRARADTLIDAAAFAEHKSRSALFPLYRAAMERLQCLGRMLGAEDELRNGRESESDSEICGNSEKS